MASASHHISGLFFDGKELEWTTLARRKGGFDPATHHRASLEAEEDTDAAPWIRSEAGRIKPPVTAGLPADTVLLRVVDLPAEDDEELEGMVDLQVDKISPFPVEGMVVSHEILAREEGQTRVLIAAVQRSRVEELGTLMQRAGIPLRRIDVDLLGWWHLLQTAGEVPGEGRYVLLIDAEPLLGLTVVQDGVPLAFRALERQGDTPRAEWIEETVEETGYTLTSLESEWGLIQTRQIKYFHAEDPPHDLLERLRQECGDVESHRLEESAGASEGLVRRTIALGPAGVDLAPPEWAEALSAKKLRRRLVKTTALLVILWALVMGGLFAGLQWEENQMKNLQAEVSRFEEPAELVVQMNRKLNSLEQFADRTYSALEAFREISMVLPNGVDLTSFVYKKNKEVSLRGISPSANPIYDFVEKLEQSKLFVEVKPDDIRSKTNRGRRITEFRVTASLPEEEE